MGETHRPRRCSREELEQVWVGRVQAAKDRYQTAVEVFDKALADSRGLMEPPDGSFAVQQARIARSYAHADYIHALKVYQDLILHGTIPVEDNEKT